MAKGDRLLRVESIDAGKLKATYAGGFELIWWPDARAWQVNCPECGMLVIAYPTTGNLKFHRPPGSGRTGCAARPAFPGLIDYAPKKRGEVPARFPPLPPKAEAPSYWAAPEITSPPVEEDEEPMRGIYQSMIAPNATVSLLHTWDLEGMAEVLRTWGYSARLLESPENNSVAFSRGASSPAGRIEGRLSVWGDGLIALVPFESSPPLSLAEIQDYHTGQLLFPETLIADVDGHGLVLKVARPWLNGLAGRQDGALLAALATNSFESMSEYFAEDGYLVQSSAVVS
jgi:hypothetical protein